MKNLVKGSQFIKVLCILFLLGSCEINNPLPKIDLSGLGAALDGGSGGGGYYGPFYISDQDTIGDVDGFGIGLNQGELWNPDTLLTSQPIDFRDINDPYFTDIWPATENGIIEYDHTFEILGDSTIHNAFLLLSTMGIQDGEHIDSLGNVDVKLFVDDVEIANAFAWEFQFESVDNQWVPKVSPVSFNAYENEEFKNLLLDGVLVVRIEVIQSGPSNELIDFAIDYSLLHIEWYE